MSPIESTKLEIAAAHIETAMIAISDVLMTNPVDESTLSYLNDLSAVVAGRAPGDRIGCARALADVCEAIIMQLPPHIDENPVTFAAEMYGCIDNRMPLLGTHLDPCVVDQLDEATAFNAAFSVATAAYPGAHNYSSPLDRLHDASIQYAMACYAAGLRHGATLEHIHHAVVAGSAEAVR